MAKKHKKRMKRYTGEDAKTTGVAGQDKPVIHRLEAKQRTALGQWAYDHKRGIKYGLIAIAIVLFIVLIIIGITQSVSQ